jgi:hypothetical protein
VGKMLIRVLGCALSCAAMMAAPLHVCADIDFLSDSKYLVLIFAEGNAGQMQQLAKVSASHVQDLGVTVSVRTVSWGPMDSKARAALVRRLVVSHRAFLAVWVEKSGDGMSLFLSDSVSSQNVSVRPFNDSPDEWAVECETLAVLIRSALISRLEFVPKKEKDKAVVAMPQKNFEASAGTDVVDSRKKTVSAPRLSVSEKKAKKTSKKPSAPRLSVSEKKAKKTSKKPSAPRPSVSEKKAKKASEKSTAARLLGRFDLGFAAAFIHRDTPWTYNAHIGTALLLLETISIGVSTQIGSYLALDIQEETKVVLRHFPIFLTAGIVHGFGKWEPGAALSFVTDIMYLDHVGGRGRINGTTRALFGMRASGKIGYRVFPFLAVVGFFGANFFFKTSRYLYRKTPVLKYGAAQPFVGVGIELFTKWKKS